MSIHKFRPGQRVQITPGASRANHPYVSRYTIVGLMPSDGRAALAYRVKGDGETYERIVQEAHLEATF